MMTATKTLLAGVALAAVMAMGMPGTAQALTITKYEGNDPFPNTNASTGNSISLAKLDGCTSSGGGFSCPTKEDGASPGNYSNAFTFASAADGKSGTWSFNPAAVTGLGANPVLYPKYVAVKGGPDYLVYAYDNGVLSGSWSTALLSVGTGNAPTLSHISFYDTTTVVPIPAALPLMLTALGGLGLIARRRAKGGEA